MAARSPLDLGGASRPAGASSFVVHRGRPLTGWQRIRFAFRRFISWV